MVSGWSKRALFACGAVLGLLGCGQEAKAVRLAASAVTAAIEEPSEDCGPEGDAKAPQVKALNRLKNRDQAPEPSQINPHITMEALLAPGDDRTRWKANQGASFIAYVSEVKPGGIETVNCKAKGVDDRDTHIELVADPMNGDPTQRVIVEVTPRWRKAKKAQGIDWRTSAIRDQFKGRWVRVTGWMLLDVEHLGQAENTSPGRSRNWRGTAWEPGHPVTGLEVVTRPKD